MLTLETENLWHQVGTCLVGSTMDSSEKRLKSIRKYSGHYKWPLSLVEMLRADSVIIDLNPSHHAI